MNKNLTVIFLIYAILAADALSYIVYQAQEIKLHSVERVKLIYFLLNVSALSYLVYQAQEIKLHSVERVKLINFFSKCQ